MRISFSSSSLAKLANSSEKLTKKYGENLSGSIRQKITQLKAFENLGQVPTHPPFCRHKMSGTYKGCFAIDVLGRKNPNRIAFKPVDENENEIIGIDNVSEITCIQIVFIGNYH